MALNSVLHAQITVALQNLRRARFEGDLMVIDVAEHHLNRLLDRLELVPA